jgi:hypothetical protein
MKKASVALGILLIILTAMGCASGTSPQTTATTPSVTVTTSPKYTLQCLSWSNYREYDYIHVVGEVKNISDSKLENVVATVAFRTEDGTLVKTDEALIDYDVLMPGQTSSFTVMTSDNPAIKKLGLSFKFFWGDKIPTEYIE